jgi:hypothetical protein
MANLTHRFLGLLIILKAIIPVVLFLSVITVGLYLYWRVDRIISQTWAITSDQVQIAQAQIDSVKQEASRILAEVKNIQTNTGKFNEDIEAAIEPLRQSLYGLQNALKTVVSAVESVCNQSIAGLNKIPFVRLKNIRLHHLFDTPAFFPALPKMNLEMHANFSAIEQLTIVTQQIVADLENTVYQLKSLFTVWWALIKILLYLLLLWFAISAVGYLARLSDRLKIGMRLLKGERIDDGIHYL